MKATQETARGITWVTREVAVLGEDVTTTWDGGVAVVTLNRPRQRNAMTLAMWREVARVFGELGRNADVRAIVLAGAGGHFSVGADISEFDQVRATSEQSAGYEVAVDACSDAIAAVSKPDDCRRVGLLPRRRLPFGDGLRLPVRQSVRDSDSRRAVSSTA